MPRKLIYGFSLPAAVLAAAFTVFSGNVIAADFDSDGIDDELDNCIEEPNGPAIPDAGGNSQWDTDGDGYGNICDSDFNQNGIVDPADFSIVKAALGTARPDQDLNGNSIVDPADFSIVKSSLGQPPGPSCCGSIMPINPAISIVSGNNQTGEVGTTLPDPLVIEVINTTTGNPMNGRAVTFAVTAGGGSVAPDSAVTDASGQASTTLTLGSEAGTNTVSATATGIGTVNFSATATAVPTQITLTPTDSSTAIGTAITYDASIRDAAGNLVTTATNPVSLTVNGVSGTFNPALPVTPVNGVASVSFTPSTGGPATISASSSGLTGASTGLTVTDPMISIVSGNNQTGEVGTTLPDPLVIEVIDTVTGNPVSGTTVSFAVTAGGGFVAPDSAVTNAAGRTSTSLTLGPLPGINTVEASAAGAGSAEFTASITNAITIENAKPGNPEYETIRFYYTDTEIAGYADATSVNVGGMLALKVSMAQPGNYSIDVYRFGYYGGDSARLITSVGPLSGITQPNCQVTEPATRLVECQWSTSYTLAIGNDWTSGVYMARLQNNSTGRLYPIFFIVRNDSSTADIVFQSSVTTALAYSNYGTPTEQYSLYGYNSTGGQSALKVSFDRPSLEFREYSNFLRYEYNMIRWLESQGYDVTYVSNMDVHENPGQLLQHKAFLSVGHDEYWSLEMRDGIETARDMGVNLGFFSANTAYWRVRFEPSSSGQPNRVMACYKDPLLNDPVAPTYLWRGPENNRPENALLGVMYTGDYGLLYGGFDFTVTQSSDPYYDNTGLVNNDSLSALVGYEWDAVVDNGFSPPGLVILSESAVIPSAIAPGLPPGTDTTVSHSVKYTASSGAKVFSTGSIQWMWGLDSNWVTPPRSDTRAQQFAVNVLADFGARPVTPDTGLIIP